MFREIVARMVGQLANGNFKNVSMNAAGDVNITPNTLRAGEDLSNDVQKTEVRGTLSNISTGVGTQVKTGTGEIYSVTINNAGSSWEIDLYDGTSSAGTSIGKIRGATLPINLNYNGAFSAGLFIDTVKGTTVGDLTVSYR